jgi:hypothetical protein
VSCITPIDAEKYEVQRIYHVSRRNIVESVAQFQGSRQEIFQMRGCTIEEATVFKKVGERHQMVARGMHFSPVDTIEEMFYYKHAP